ncbi:MAG: glycosyltransferase [Thermomicrobiales bacterium]
MVDPRAAAPVLLATYGSPGDLHPFIAIARELEAQGQPAVIASSAIYRDRVEGAGLAFAPMRPDRAPAMQEPDFLQRLRRGERPAHLFREMFMPGLHESTLDLVTLAAGARAVVSHTLVGGGRLAAEVHGLPWISAVMQPMGYLSAYEPPVIGLPGLASALRAVGPRRARAAMNLAEAATAGWVSEWGTLRRTLGLPAVADHPLFAGQHSPLRSLGLFPRTLGEPMPDWPAAARITGFPFLRDPRRSLPDELEAFLEAGPPPVVFTLGTTAVNDPGDFYRVSAAAARDLGMRAVLLTGNAGADAAGDDTLNVPYAPHDLLFPRSRAVVHQGGIGTLAEGMKAGAPMVIVPYAHDQADNAWRAQRLGIADIAPRGRSNARALTRSLRRVLASREGDAARIRVRRDVAGEDGAARAARAILEVLQS